MYICNHNTQILFTQRAEAEEACMFYPENGETMIFDGCDILV